MQRGHLALPACLLTESVGPRLTGGRSVPGPPGESGQSWAEPVVREPWGGRRARRPVVPSAGRDEGPTSEPDEALVDECCLLPSQLLIPSLDWLPVSDGLVSRLQPKQPLRLHFGKAPALLGSATALQLDGLSRCVPCSASGPLWPFFLEGSPQILPDSAHVPLSQGLCTCCLCCFLLSLT